MFIIINRYPLLLSLLLLLLLLITAGSPCLFRLPFQFAVRKETDNTRAIRSYILPFVYHTLSLVLPSGTLSLCLRDTVTLHLAVNETVTELSSLPILMQESFWW